MKCCMDWSPYFGCPHEICPGCYCDKEHEQNVCSDCHDYNRGHDEYLATYGPENLRSLACACDCEPDPDDGFEGGWRPCPPDLCERPAHDHPKAAV